MHIYINDTMILCIYIYTVFDQLRHCFATICPRQAPPALTISRVVLLLGAPAPTLTLTLTCAILPALTMSRVVLLLGAPAPTLTLTCAILHHTPVRGPWAPNIVRVILHRLHLRRLRCGLHLRWLRHWIPWPSLCLQSKSRSTVWFLLGVEDFSENIY